VIQAFVAATALKDGAHLSYSQRDTGLDRCVDDVVAVEPDREPERLCDAGGDL
jgi:hypothetical protein